MISFHLPEFSQAAKIQIIAQVSAWISTMLPLKPLLPYLTEQSLYIHLRFHRLVETHLVNDLFLDRLIAGEVDLIVFDESLRGLLGQYRYFFLHMVYL